MRLCEVFTFDQVSRQRMDVVRGIPEERARTMALQRCRQRCDSFERPVREEMDGRGVAFRNFSRYVEVAAFLG